MFASHGRDVGLIDEERYKKKDDEMLRVIYVGITRAKHALYIYNNTSFLNIQPSISHSLSMRDVFLDYFRNKNINVQIGFINFTPYSDVSTLRQNAYYLNKHHFINSCQISNKLRAYKGTDLYAKLKEDGLISENNGLDYYEYHFELQDINDFCEFILECFDTINAKERINIQAIDWYLYFTYPRYISYYRSLFRKMNVGFEQELDQWETEYFRIINENSELYYNWYSSLLDVLERGWDKKEGLNTSCQIDISKASVDVMKKLKGLMKRFHYHVIKSNRSLLKYLVNDRA